MPILDVPAAAWYMATPFVIFATKFSWDFCAQCVPPFTYLLQEAVVMCTCDHAGVTMVCPKSALE